MMKSLRLFRTIAMYVAASTLFAAPPAFAQDIQDPQAVLAATDWVTPPDQIAEAVLAPRYLNATLTNVSPDKRWFFHEIGDGPVTMDRFSKVFDELGGLFIDFNANRDRRLTIRTNIGIDIISAEDGAKVAVDIPDGARVSNATWSPDGSRLAFYAHTGDATHIYVADPATGRSRQITRRPVLATLVTTFEWTSNGEGIATVLLPDDRTQRPIESTVPTGPQVKMTAEGENLLRTYASLMATPHDEALLEWHATGQRAVIDVGSRNVQEIGQPTMIRSFDFSPDGQYARVTRVQPPFSYIVPVNNFATVEEVWDLEGAALAQLDETPMNVGIQDPNQPPRGLLRGVPYLARLHGDAVLASCLHHSGRNRFRGSRLRISRGHGHNVRLVASESSENRVDAIHQLACRFGCATSV